MAWILIRVDAGGWATRELLHIGKEPTVVCLWRHVNIVENVNSFMDNFKGNGYT